MKNKKSFVLYCDLIHTVNQLPDDKAGLLFKHVLSYVNDEDPISDDIIVKIAFEPIKQQLKRDLLKYEKKREQYSEAGKKSAEARKQKKLAEKEAVNESQRTLTNVESRSTNSTVSVNVNDNVNVSVTDNKKKKKSSLSDKEQKFLDLFNTLKKQKTNKESGFRVLSKTDKSNLDQLSSYTVGEFKLAINSMLEADWPRETKNQTPTHILRVDNFNRYLSTAQQTVKPEDEDLNERAARLTKETKEQ